MGWAHTCRDASTPSSARSARNEESSGVRAVVGVITKVGRVAHGSSIQRAARPSSMQRLSVNVQVSLDAGSVPLVLRHNCTVTWFRRRQAWYGDCPKCGHDWREHIAPEPCSECEYEIEHEELGAPTEACTVVAPPPT